MMKKNSIGSSQCRHFNQSIYISFLIFPFRWNQIWRNCSNIQVFYLKNSGAYFQMKKKNRFMLGSERLSTRKVSKNTPFWLVEVIETSFENHSKRLSPAMSENDALQHNPCLTEEGIGKCKPNYVFKNNVQLTSDTDEFKKELEKIVKVDFQIHGHF